MHARVAGERFDAVFSITGAFDPIAASRFRDRLAELPPDACVLFDFSHAWEGGRRWRRGFRAIPAWWTTSTARSAANGSAIIDLERRCSAILNVAPARQ